MASDDDSIASTAAEMKKFERAGCTGSLNASIVAHRRSSEYGNSTMLSIICPIVNEGTLTEYFLEDKHWKTLMAELKNPDRSEQEIIDEIRQEYGYKKRSAIMTICVCDPPLDVVKLLVELGGKKDSEEEAVCEVGHCGFTSLHYACWGNASLEVIKYLLRVGGKKSLLTKSANAGQTALHLACVRYRPDALPDLITHLLKVGKHEVATALDDNEEFPLQCLLLRPGNLPVEAIKTFLEEWYEIEKSGGVAFSAPALPTGRSQLLKSTDVSNTDDFYDNCNDIATKSFKDRVEFKNNFNKVIRQLLKSDPDSRSQILTTKFMMEYLTERFIQPLPLAILIMDLYVQILIVCVFSLFINNSAPNAVDSTTTTNLLIFCVVWRLLREAMQVMTTSFGSYVFDISNWLDITQSVLIIYTINADLDDFSSERRNLLILPTLIAWFELLFELHNFMYDLAIFVGATIKVVKRLANFGYTLLIIVAMFAHVYYISGTGAEELCDNRDTLDDEEFINEGAFTCSRAESYKYSLVNIFNFTFPPGVPLSVSCFYAFLMVILFLNVIIAVISEAFEDAQNESEVAFWSDRLVIVNELGNITSGIYNLIEKTNNSRFIQFMERMLFHHNEGGDSVDRICLHLLLDKTDWDNIPKEDQPFIHWWYGKSKDKPSLTARLSFFLRKSRIKDILIPGSVFEGVFLGQNRSIVTCRYLRVLILPCSSFVMVVSNSLIFIFFILGWVSFGLAWPYKMKLWMFTVDKGKNTVTNVTEKKNEEISEMKTVISDMRIQISDMGKKQDENNRRTAKLLSNITSLLSRDLNADSDSLLSRETSTYINTDIN